jgi:hypothetical protein
MYKNIPPQPKIVKKTNPIPPVSQITKKPDITNKKTGTKIKKNVPPPPPPLTTSRIKKKKIKPAISNSTIKVGPPDFPKTKKKSGPPPLPKMKKKSGPPPLPKKK